MNPVPATQYTTGTQANFVAMQFSPNFPSDQMAVALAADKW